MPQPGSMYSSVAPGLGGQASPMDPRLAQLAMQGMPGMGGASPVPPSRQMAPPDPMSSGPGGPPSYGALPPQGQDPSMGMDRLQKVVELLMNPNLKLNPEMLLLFAGIGANVALDNIGKPPMTKQHRSNAELSAQGQDVGNAGQTGMQDPKMMERGLQVNVPGGMGRG